MKFLEADKDTQVALMGLVLAGCFEVLSRDQKDGGRVLVETALSRVGLTADEFKELINPESPEIVAQIESVMGAPQASGVITDEQMFSQAVHDFAGMQTEVIKQGLLDRDIISIEQSERMNRTELLQTIVEYRRTVPDFDMVVRK